MTLKQGGLTACFFGGTPRATAWSGVNFAVLPSQRVVRGLVLAFWHLLHLIEGH